MKNFIAIIIIGIINPFFNNYLLSQGNAGNKASIESRYIVDMPTAGVVSIGYFSSNIKFFSTNGISSEFSYGVLANLNIGASISGENIIGSGDPTFQSIPGVHIKYRFLNETLTLPAIAVGLNTQGNGVYSNSSNRFQYYSPGLFLSLSKSFLWDVGDIALHGGINYSFENPSDDILVNYYFGIEQSLSDRAAVCIEFNASVFEREKEIIDVPGLVNLSFRYSIGSGYTMELQFKDLLINYKNSKSFVRFFALEYVSRL